MTLAQELLTEIQTYCATHGMGATNFGVAALSNPSFVGRLRDGMQPTAKTVDKVRAFMRSAS